MIRLPWVTVGLLVMAEINLKVLFHLNIKMFCKFTSSFTGMSGRFFEQAIF
jgi:hypothetical protein